VSTAKWPTIEAAQHKKHKSQTTINRAHTKKTPKNKETKKFLNNLLGHLVI
jgi:hypothetical protein